MKNVEDPQQPLRHVGRYELAEEMWRSPIGEAFRARRNDGAYSQNVALEVFTGVAHDELVGRRRSLAGLEHPSLCQLLDAGSTDSGDPFLVFEQVDGLSLAEHCRRAGLDWRTRTALLVRSGRACEAMHRRLLVHGAIGPETLRVDDHGEPRLRGLGLAALSAAAGRDVSQQTDLEQLAEVCADVLELSADGLRGAPADLRHVVTAARSSSADSPYGSVGEFAEDLENVLESRPVKLRAGSGAYVFGRFVSRHRGPVAVAALLGSLVVMMTAVFLSRLRDARDLAAATELDARLEQARAEAARDESEALLDFVVDLFSAANPRKRPPGEAMTARELLTEGEELVDRRLGEQPRGAARMWAILGKLRRRLGDPEVSVEHLRRALDAAGRVDRSAMAVQDPEAERLFASELLIYQQELANGLNLLGRPDEGAEILRAVAEEAARLHGERSDRFAHAAHNLSLILFSLERAEEGLQWARRAEAAYAALDREDWRTGSLEAQGLLLSVLGRYREAVPLLQEVVNYRSVARPGSPSLSNGHLNLGAMLVDAGRWERGVAELERALSIVAQTPNGGAQANAVRLHMAGVLLGAGQVERAAMVLDSFDPAPETLLPWMAAALPGTRTYLEMREGRVSEAAEKYAQDIERVASYFGPEHTTVLELHVQRAEALGLAGARDEALALLDEVIVTRERLHGPRHPGLARPLEQRARWALELGNLEAARRDLQRAVQLLEIGQFEDGADLIRVREALQRQAP